MIQFTSNRERALWAASFGVVAAIALTSALAGRLVDVWGSEALLGAAFAAGLGLAATSVVGVALSGGRGRTVWIGIGLLAVVWMIPVRGGAAALERTHLFEYGLLAVILYETLSERRAATSTPRRPALVAIVATALLGWLDEALQAWIPGRVYDLRDVGVNALAGLVAVAVLAGLQRLRTSRR